MKILLDTNVILDYLLKREGFCEDAKEIFNLAAQDDTYEYVSASAITDIFYIMNKHFKDSHLTQQKIKALMRILTVLQVSEDDIENAINLHWNDFEDAVQYAVAVKNGVDIIITRNVNDYEESKISIYTPKDFLNYVKKTT